MHIVMFYHSLRSDWNHGNAHFLRGVVSELDRRGHTVDVYEPADAWSVNNLATEYGPEAVSAYRSAYPNLESATYDARTLDLDSVLRGADMVIVHEWNDHELVARIGAHRAERGGYRLFFHDTHHRAVTDAESMAAYDLRHYDGVLAFGNVIRDIYRRNGWADRVWTWHEAADTRVFHPMPLAVDSRGFDGDLVWIGNWGDDERSAELYEFLLNPVRRLGLRAKVYGVRYPAHALDALADAGIEYGGWLPNYRAPEVFARYKFTIHVPRRPYATALPGIPTIRVFEALACGMPLISAPWRDIEGLFTPGEDFLTARDGAEMMDRMSRLLADPDLQARLSSRGLATIEARHTCAHRVDELLGIYDETGRLGKRGDLRCETREPAFTGSQGGRQ